MGAVVGLVMGAAKRRPSLVTADQNEIGKKSALKVNQNTEIGTTRASDLQWNINPLSPTPANLPNELTPAKMMIKINKTVSEINNNLINKNDSKQTFKLTTELKQDAKLTNHKNDFVKLTNSRAAQLLELTAKRLKTSKTNYKPLCHVNIHPKTFKLIRLPANVDTAEHPPFVDQSKEWFVGSEISQNFMVQPSPADYIDLHFNGDGLIGGIINNGANPHPGTTFGCVLHGAGPVISKKRKFEAMHIDSFAVYNNINNPETAMAYWQYLIGNGTGISSKNDSLTNDILQLMHRNNNTMKNANVHNIDSKNAVNGRVDHIDLPINGHVAANNNMNIHPPDVNMNIHPSDANMKIHSSDVNMNVHPADDNNIHPMDSLTKDDNMNIHPADDNNIHPLDSLTNHILSSTDSDDVSNAHDSTKDSDNVITIDDSAEDQIIDGTLVRRLTLANLELWDDLHYGWTPASKFYGTIEDYWLVDVLSPSCFLIMLLLPLSIYKFRNLKFQI